MALDVERIEKPVRKLRKLLKKAPKHPTPDKVHDLRTNSRRFQTAVEAFALASHGNERRLLKGLRRLRKRAGKIRDMDVLIGHALTVNPNGEQDCVVQLLEHLGAIRARQARKLHDEMVKATPLRTRLKRSQARIEKLATKNNGSSSGKAPAKAPPDVISKSLQLSAELKAPARLDKKNLHPYRLKVKALRYVLQLSDRADQPFIEKLGEVQDAIGEWHDWLELSEIAEKVIDHGAKCKLVARLKEVAERKFQGALDTTNEMRRAYLMHPGPKREAGKLRTPVLEAASALTA